MSIPTVGDFDNGKLNLDRLEQIVNGAANLLVTLSDASQIKTLRGFLQQLVQFNPVGAWATSTAYQVKDIVSEGGVLYICIEDHTSTVFATDQASGKWGLYQIDFTEDVFFLKDLTVDTDTFHVDSANNRVSIGTLSASTQFHLQKSTSGGVGAEIFLKNSAGSAIGNKVGISFATDSGGTTINNPRIEAENVNASNGASQLNFYIHPGGGVQEKIFNLVRNGLVSIAKLDAQLGTDTQLSLEMGTGSGGANKSRISYQNSVGSEIFFNEFDNSSGVFKISSDLVSNAFVIDRTTGNIGKGTLTPGNAIDIQSTSEQPSITLNSTVDGSGSVTGGRINLTLTDDTSNPNHSGDRQGVLQFLGQSNTAVFSAGAIDLVTGVGEDTSTNMTTDMRFHTKSSGAGGQTVKMTLFSTGGLNLGAPTGGDKGAGTINVTGDIYKNNSAYTNPDYVAEKYFTGDIVKFKDKPGAKDYEFTTLETMEEIFSTTFRLPGITDAPLGSFERSDILLEKLEEAMIYIIELNKKNKDLESRISKLEKIMEGHINGN